MKFLADMGISPSTVAWLLAQNHDAVHVKDVGLGSAPDKDLLRLAAHEERILLTMDLDFGDLLAAGRLKMPSVILFRLEDEKPSNVNLELGEILRSSTKELVEGCIISVGGKKPRIRMLPIGGKNKEIK